MRRVFSHRERWTRREFVRGAAGVLSLPYLRRGNAEELARQVAYVACGPSRAGGPGAICVLRSDEARWLPIQRVPSLAPAFILHAPAAQMLYVANDVSVHEGLPRGTVEVFRTDPADGTLTLVNQIPLSLSATHPRHIALSPDGKWLAVAAYGGGIYNLLPVARDGNLGAPRGIFKATGRGAHTTLQVSAHPHTLLFDNSGRHLLASDFGSDRISVFAVEEGRLIRRAEHFLPPGSGPGACVLHPAGFLYAAHDLGKRIGCYRYDVATGEISESFHEHASGSSPISLALHPSGRALYASDEGSGTLRVMQVNATSGGLRLMQNVALGDAGSVRIFPARDGQSVSMLEEHRGLWLHAIADQTTGELGLPVHGAALDAPRSLAVYAV